MKTEKNALTVLCIIACLLAARMLIGVAYLALHHHMSVVAGCFELLLFAGAGVIPLIAVWFSREANRMWLYVLWAPCILYVVFLSIRLSLHGYLFSGCLRLALWIAIGVLFTRSLDKTKAA